MGQGVLPAITVNTVAKLGVAMAVHSTRSHGLPMPARLAMRQAHTSIAKAGSAPAIPKPCSRKSATTLPNGPARLVACWDVAVFKDGSRGL